MEILYSILVVLHLLGWAVAFGGLVAGMRETVLNRGVLHGVLTALATGIILVGLSYGVGGPDVNNVKITIKLIIAIAVVALVFYGQSNKEKVSRGLLGAMAALVAANVAIAVIW